MTTRRKLKIFMWILPIIGSIAISNTEISLLRYLVIWYSATFFGAIIWYYAGRDAEKNEKKDKHI